MDYGIFNVSTDTNACDCTRGCTDTVRESALKIDSEQYPLPHGRIEPALAACRSVLYPLSYIPSTMPSEEAQTSSSVSVLLGK